MAEKTVTDDAAGAAYSDEWTRFDVRTRLVQAFWILLSAAVFVYSWQSVTIHYQFILNAPQAAMDLIDRMYPPYVSYFPELVAPMIETIHIAVLGTMLALLIAAPVSYLAAENTTMNSATYFLGKLIVSGSRSVNTIIWALLLVIVFGPGALAGTIAIGIRSVGMCAKLLAEEIEEIDFGQTEAITATGADGLIVLVYGIVPQIKPAFIGIATYRWDINVRGSTILGFVGAGGIGRVLLNDINSFAWHNVLTILIAILAIVIFSESFSAWARRKAR